MRPNCYEDGEGTESLIIDFGELAMQILHQLIYWVSRGALDPTELPESYWGPFDSVGEHKSTHHLNRER